MNRGVSVSKLFFIAALPLLCIFFFSFDAYAPKAYALEGGEYTPPSAWSQHHSFGGSRYNYGGASIGGGSFDATVTSRTVYRSFKDDALSEYAYLRLKLSDLPAASGSLNAALYLRGAFASEEFDTGF
ncbi:MAG: hypothetical protein LBD73_02620, partial [Deferribacteraceae bacterium]|nr:hypothetical protein [Deferribacteraceae bacterium]